MIIQSTEIKKKFLELSEDLDRKKLCLGICKEKTLNRWLEYSRDITERQILDLCERVGMKIRITIIVKEVNTDEFRKEKDNKGYSPINRELNNTIDRVSSRCS